MAERIYKTKRSGTGAQFYQSDKNRKDRLKAKGGTEMDDLIRQALTEKVISGDISATRAGEFSANQFFDSLDDAYKKKGKKK